MPLKAFCEELKRDVMYNEFLFIDIPRKGHYKCPFCDSKMVPVNGKFSIHHFRHKIICPYQTEPESQTHINMKDIFYRIIPLRNKVNKIEIEKKIGHSIADVYCEIDGKKIAIECQCSRITISDWEKRNEKYSSEGVYVLWVLLKKGYMQKVRKIDLMLQQLNFGRCGCFYIQRIDECSIQNYHYRKSFFKGSDNEWHIVRKRERPIVLNDINFKIITAENKGIKTARFLHDV